MAVINILSKQVSELIAAGEVIERPASVIKELVENAIDAHATDITVEIKNGGITFMRVTDNGCGMERDDVKNAFLRHATSKIAEQEDLDSIATLSLRGEALASICAVSRVDLITRSAGETTGILYRLEGGAETAFQETGAPQGTTFVVRDLFYNVPARMKFLKKDTAEANSVSTLMDRIALSHPEIGFTFIRDGRQMLKTSGKGDLATAIFQVFGKQFYEGLIPVRYQYQGITLRGFVSKPVSANRASRSMQVFFVNGRYVRTKTGMAALEQAYKGFIMAGKFPACVLSMEMNCSTLDVNVHPAKLEIRFTNERPVYECLYHGVRTALSSYDTRREDVRPEGQAANLRLLGQTADRGSQLGFAYASGGTGASAGKAEEEPEVTAPAPADFDRLELHDAAPAGVNPHYPSDVTIRPISLSEYRQNRQNTSLPILRPERPEITLPAGEAASSKPLRETSPGQEAAASLWQASSDEGEAPIRLSDQEQTVPTEEISSSDALEPSLPEKQEVPSPGRDGGVTLVEKEQREIPKRFIGEAFSAYIILEYGEDRLMFIDKHAAHERLIYEKLKAHRPDAAPQLLLEPLTVTLDKGDYQSVVENREVLAEAGFEVEEFGSTTVLIRGVPAFVEKLEITEAFLEIASYLTKHKKLLLSEKMEWIFQNTACRAAVKAGNRNHPEELIALVRELEQHPEVKYCPHGRPIWFFLSKSELEKNFKRI